MPVSRHPALGGALDTHAHPLDLMSEPIKITKIEVVPGATIKKYTITRYQGRGGTDSGFEIEVRYTLEDGRFVHTAVCRSRKKDIMEAVEHAQYMADTGNKSAKFDEAGKFIGTQDCYDLTGKDKSFAKWKADKAKGTT
jgi:hypothetical protein